MFYECVRIINRLSQFWIIVFTQLLIEYQIQIAFKHLFLVDFVTTDPQEVS
jgi:hypothetical protein